MSWISILDTDIALYLNTFSHRIQFVYRLAVFVSNDEFLKGGVFCALFAWLWFARGPRQVANRSRLVILCAGGIVAVFLSRLTQQQALPFRLRPIHDPALHLTLPYEIDYETLAHWSSFPSDHAVLYGALATGLFWISRSAGLIACFWTLIVILAPRLFLGLHFLSDIYVGLAFGVLIMMMAIWMKPNLSRFVRLALRTEGARPSLFYAAGLLFIWQMNTAFPDVRAGLRAATKLIQRAPVQSEMSVHERLGEQGPAGNRTGPSVPDCLSGFKPEAK